MGLIGKTDVKQKRNIKKTKLTTAYVVKMFFFYVMLIVLGFAGVFKLLHVMGINHFGK